jgi:hypothetical protein
MRETFDCASLDRRHHVLEDIADVVNASGSTPIIADNVSGGCYFFWISGQDRFAD